MFFVPDVPLFPRRATDFDARRRQKNQYGPQHDITKPHTQVDLPFCHRDVGSVVVHNFFLYIRLHDLLCSQCWLVALNNPTTAFMSIFLLVRRYCVRTFFVSWFSTTEQAFDNSRMQLM